MGRRGKTLNWRKGWDSNPRGSVNPLAVFKTAALNHSATLPSFEIVQQSSSRFVLFAYLDTRMVTNANGPATATNR